MKKSFLLFGPLFAVLCLPAQAADGLSTLYDDPPGGWAYVYTGDAATGAPKGQNQFALDGTWRHENGSDEWNGDPRGPANPPAGGAESDNGVLTIEDATTVTSGSLNNRKLYFTHATAQDGVNSVNLLDTGVTLFFRARLTPADSKAEIALPNGYGIFSNGKGNFGVRQSSPSSIVSFSLVQAFEDGDSSSSLNFPAAGLTMNRLNGDVPGTSGTILQGVNSSDIAANNPIVAVDPTVFHEFWITIQANDATPGNGTHQVNVYVDGSTVPQTFNVTAGEGADADTTVTPNWTDYLAIGCNNSPTAGAFDTDFFAYAPGVIAPTAPTLPVILSQPASRTNLVGSNPSFAVQVQGQQPLHYQWYFNETEPVPGANTNTLTLSNVQAAQSGSYLVVISNALGAVTSAPAYLLVAPIFITTQPQDRSVLVGQNATFSVVATVSAPPASYQWRFNGVDIPNATGASYTRPSAQVEHAGDYSVLVSDLNSSLESAVARLTVLVLPAFVQQPQSQILTVGSELRLRVEVSGTQPIGFRWRRDSREIVPFTEGTDTLVIPRAMLDQGGSYDVVVTNAARPTGLLSQKGYVLMVDPPKDRMVLAASDVTLQAQAMGPGTTYYQWKFNGADLPGATSSTLALTAVTANESGPYSLWLSNNLVGRSAEFPMALTVHLEAVAPAIVVQPTNQVVQTNGEARLAVVATGTEPLAFQWWFEGTNELMGAVGPDLVLTNLQPADYGGYTVVVSNMAGATTSEVATLSLPTPPVIVTEPVGQTLAPGATLTLAVEAAGLEPLGYQWWFNQNPLAGATDATLVINGVAATNAGEYYVVVDNPVGSVTSQVAVVVVAVADSDGDGIPDDWEREFGLNPDSDADADLDGDGDGLTNRQEYRAGTDPTVSSSVLKLETLPVGTGELTLQFNAVSNRAYSIEYRDGVGVGDWLPLPGVDAAESNRLVEITNLLGTNLIRYYRIGTPGP